MAVANRIDRFHGVRFSLPCSVGTAFTFSEKFTRKLFTQNVRNNVFYLCNNHRIINIHFAYAILKVFEAVCFN